MPTSQAQDQAKPKATRVGIVQSDARAKTRKVVIPFSAKHPKYGKYVANQTVLHVHDEGNVSKMGDHVEIEPCRPISKTKTWKVVRVVVKSSN